MVHASIGTPSTWTVHAPQDESSQARFEPVRPNSWRSTSSNRAFGCTASSCVRLFTRNSINSFFISKFLINRHGRVNLARPAIDAAAQGLCFFESLLPQPRGHVHGPHSVMAHHYDVVVGIEFLLKARRHVAHRHVRAAGNSRRLNSHGSRTSSSVKSSLRSRRDF